MKGNILTFDESTNRGKISGFDGNRYDFTRSDWKSKGNPIQHCVVDFEIQENEAKDVFILSPQRNSKVTSYNTETIGGLGILCFLFPILGLILYLLWNESKPLKSKGAGNAALWGFIFTFVFSLLGIIVAVSVY